MVTADIPTEVIRRWGRWLSDCWRRYVFGAAEELENLSRTMVQTDYTLAMALEDSRASAPRGHNPVYRKTKSEHRCQHELIAIFGDGGTPRSRYVSLHI